MLWLRSLRSEIGPMLSLAGPVVLAELGWMAMGIVDTLMVGRLGPAAIGAVGIGSTVFLAISIPGFGLLFGLETFIAQAFGAGRRADCHRWLLHGIYLSLILLGPLMLAAVAVIWLFGGWGLAPDVHDLTVSYLAIVTGSLLPLLLYGTFRRYLQAMNVVRPVMFALVSANLVNVAVNWLLIFGHWGAPRLGVDGAAWATVISRVYMATVLLAAIFLHDRTERTGLTATPLGLSFEWLRRLARLGSPAAAQVTLEVGVFAAATALAGRLDTVSLAAHHIALTVIGTIFMVPLGVSMAGAVRVGHAVGRRDPHGVSRAGWTAIALGAGFMIGSALLLLFAPRWLVRLFTADADLVDRGAALLRVAVLFQLFDGLQVVATGALRGLGDTRTPMRWNLAGHWLIGLPLGYWLCFALGWGVVGLWFGLSAGLTIVGIVLLRTWWRRSNDPELVQAA
jgi:MATE family multidrug resistance protein